MNEQQRCATCKHWRSDDDIDLIGWGVCRWPVTEKHPWWMSPANKAEQTTGTEGEHCATWEAKS